MLSSSFCVKQDKGQATRNSTIGYEILFAWSGLDLCGKQGQQQRGPVSYTKVSTDTSDKQVRVWAMWRLSSAGDVPIEQAGRRCDRPIWSEKTVELGCSVQSHDAMVSSKPKGQRQSGRCVEGMYRLYNRWNDVPVKLVTVSPMVWSRRMMRRDAHSSHKSPRCWTKVNIAIDKRTVLNGSKVQDVLRENPVDDIGCLRGEKKRLG